MEQKDREMNSIHKFYARVIQWLYVGLHAPHIKMSTEMFSLRCVPEIKKRCSSRKRHIPVRFPNCLFCRFL